MSYSVMAIGMTPIVFAYSNNDLLLFGRFISIIYNKNAKLHF